MATIVGNNQVKLSNGQTVSAQEGGWYDGQQFVGGTLSNSGQINAKSNQQGAGQQVSSQVVAQTNPNNVSFIQGGGAQGQQGKQLTTPTNPQDVQGYLNSYQNNVNQSLSGSTLTGNNADTVLATAINENRPQPPNLSQTYTSLAGQFNITGLNQQMTDLQTKANTIQTSLQTAQTQTEFQPGVTADVVAGRESEQQRLAQIQLDSVNLQMGVVSQQLTNANNTIGMIMNFTQQDYTNASQSYEASVNDMLQFQQLTQQQQQFQQSQQQQEAQFEQSQQQQLGEFGVTSTQQQQQIQLQQKQLGFQAQQVASANLGVVMSMVTSGQINMANLTPDQQAHIQSLETQAGLPAGITAQITQNAPAGAKILNVNSGTGQAVLQLANGRIQTMEIPNATLQPQSFSFSGGNYMYAYNKNTGKYELAPGQKNWLQQIFPGIFKSPPSEIDVSQMNNQSTGATNSLNLIDPRTGNIIQADNQQEYQQLINQGYRAQ